MTAIGVPVVRLPHAQDMDFPVYATAHAAGLDLMAAIDKAITLEAGRRALVATGIAIALPVGYEAQVRPRSGLAVKHGVTVLNSPGTIDADYRGEIKVILINLGQESFVIEPKARIAQLIVSAVARILWTPAEELPDTARGDGGFGSTGTRQIGA